MEINPLTPNPQLATRNSQRATLVNKRIFTVSIIIILFALYIHTYPFHKIIPLKKSLGTFPVQLKGWTGRDYFFDNIILDKLGVSEYIMREYRRGNNIVTLYIGYYSSQSKESQIHSPKYCLPGSGWFKLSERKRELFINGVGDISFIEAVYKKGDDREVFQYWYKMKNEYITNEYILKLYMILNSLRYGRNDAAFIRLSSLVTDETNNVSQLLDDFKYDFLPLLKDYLPE